MPKPSSLGAKIWSVCCSLNLAISLASLITLLTIYGSLRMHANPGLFADLDRYSLRTWFLQLPGGQLDQVRWMLAAGFLLLLFGLNTLCCFIDWALRIRSRWRKTGEYLTHLGFVLIVIAFTWGSYAGSRHSEVRLFLNERYSLPGFEGLDLIVDAVEPVMNRQDRPQDILNRVRLLQGERLLAAEQLSFNHPLLYGDLVVVPVSFGREIKGYDCFMPGLGNVRLTQGQTLSLGGGKTLRVLEFLADAGNLRPGPGPRDDRSQNPALLLDLQGPGRVGWRGWYFLRGQFPYQLLANGVRFWPVNPVFGSFSLLTINHDPGVRFALAGGVAMLAGTLLAMVSFYRKRRSNDRPEI